MKIMFLRESEGVYQFGQKRVYIKIEKGKKLMVRVGGGYMNIDDFINMYSPSEEDRIQRKDVLGNFKRKTNLQQIAVNYSTHQRELSPIKTPQTFKRPKSALKYLKNERL